MTRNSSRTSKALDVLRKKMIRETEEFLARHLPSTDASPNSAHGELAPAIDRNPLSNQ